MFFHFQGKLPLVLSFHFPYWNLHFSLVSLCGLLHFYFYSYWEKLEDSSYTHCFIQMQIQ